MSSIIIKNGTIINEDLKYQGDILIKNDRIEKIGGVIDKPAGKIIDATGKLILPGIIDDQVHFREPGLIYKADISSESKAGVLGGVTSYMDMPNNNPPILDQNSLEKKYEIGKLRSYSNYSFYMGASNDNIDEVLQTDPSSVCGIKVFMGASTGNMLVDNMSALEAIFSNCELLIATHCEDENTIKHNHKSIIDKFGDNIGPEFHPLIRDHEACYKSSKLAVDLARRYGSRLHVLHLTTAKEMELFSNNKDLKNKKITSEVCVHHLYFNDEQYKFLGNKLKCNPSVKTENDRLALWKALLEGKIDIIATDHAPHTIEEKNRPYLNAPSGLPLIQHSFQMMFEFYLKGLISLEKIIEKMCHNPSILFQIKERGFIREGYWADIVIIDPAKNHKVSDHNIAYKCGWSPVNGVEFNSQVDTVLVNGTIALENGIITGQSNPMRLEFERF
ncbi:MAG: dihydroorotase [Deltaproteobacteria bacterium]